MSEEIKSASGGPVGAPRTTVLGTAPALTQEEIKAANDRTKERLDTVAREKMERGRAARIDSKATTAGHKGKHADEPHKPYEMEAAKVGKPIPAGPKGGIEIDPANKGTATDIVFPGGFGPGSPMHADDIGGALPVNPPDAAGTIRTVADGDQKPKKVEGDPGAMKGKEAHTGEDANIAPGIPAIAGPESKTGE
jgi:hypothetical protein